MESVWIVGAVREQYDEGFGSDCRGFVSERQEVKTLIVLAATRSDSTLRSNHDLHIADAPFEIDSLSLCGLLGHDLTADEPFCNLALGRFLRKYGKVTEELGVLRDDICLALFLPTSPRRRFQCDKLT